MVALAQAPLARSDVATLQPRPVFSRWYKPIMIAPHNAVPPG